MSKTIEVVVHEIATDGLPELDDDQSLHPSLLGRTAFIFDGSLYSGWPLVCAGEPPDCWESDESAGKFYGVERWVEFPIAIWDLADVPRKIQPTHQAWPTEPFA